MNAVITSRFAELIASKKLRIAQISRDTGISRGTLTNLYYGKNCAISFETLSTLCGYLACGVEDILILEKQSKIIPPNPRA